jgi:hypothetical protein
MLRNLVRLALSIGISFAILALLVKLVSTGLPEGERPSVLIALKQTSAELILAYVAIYLIQLFIRAYRYQVLIRACGEQNVPNLKQMALVTAIRNMMVDMFPARLGELSYVGLLNKGYGVKLQHCVSSLAISIAFDFLALLFVVVLVIAKQLSAGSIEGWGYGVLASAFVLSSIAFFGLFWIVPTITRWMKARSWQGSDNGIVGKLIKLTYDFSDSLIAARDSGKAITILSLSIAIRVLKYFAFYLLFIAVAGPSFAVLADLPTEKIVSALIGGELAASLPIPTFMSFGAYEAGGALVFHLLGVANKAEAVITLFGVHVWSQIVDYLFGGILLLVYLWLRRSLKRRENQLDTTQPQRARWAILASLAAGGLVFVAGSFFLAWELRAAKKMGAITPPEIGVSTLNSHADWVSASQGELKDLSGFMVWSSNRGGNHDIYRMDLPSMNIEQVTKHPHTEYFARLSPNGKRMIFSRSHQPWVSQRNLIAWDVILKDLETGRERKIATNSTYGEWISDNEVTYLTNGVAVIRHNVDSGLKSTIYRSGEQNKMPAGARISSPMFNDHTSELLFTGRQSQIGMRSGHWGTAVMRPNGSHQGIHNGCQIAWNFDGTRIFQVVPGGTMGNSFVYVNLADFSTTPWIDLEGEFGHEYWPKNSSNGEYFVFGASRGDHEHDQADYEMFLWKAGSDPSKATRLTFHTGNDNWPDVHIESDN